MAQLMCAYIIIVHNLYIIKTGEHFHFYLEPPRMRAGAIVLREPFCRNNVGIRPAGGPPAARRQCHVPTGVPTRPTRTTQLAGGLSADRDRRPVLRRQPRLRALERDGRRTGTRRRRPAGRPTGRPVGQRCGQTVLEYRQTHRSAILAEETRASL